MMYIISVLNECIIIILGEHNVCKLLQNKEKKERGCFCFADTYKTAKTCLFPQQNGFNFRPLIIQGIQVSKCSILPAFSCMSSRTSPKYRAIQFRSVLSYKNFQYFPRNFPIKKKVNIPQISRILHEEFRVNPYLFQYFKFLRKLTNSLGYQYAKDFFYFKYYHLTSYLAKILAIKFLSLSKK